MRAETSGTKLDKSSVTWSYQDLVADSGSRNENEAPEAPAGVSRMKQTNFVASAAFAFAALGSAACSKGAPSGSPAPTVKAAAHKPAECPTPGVYKEDDVGDRAPQILYVNKGPKGSAITVIDGADVMQHFYASGDSEFRDAKWHDVGTYVANCAGNAIKAVFVDNQNRTAQIVEFSFRGGKAIETINDLNAINQRPRRSRGPERAIKTFRRRRALINKISLIFCAPFDSRTKRF